MIIWAKTRGLPQMHTSQESLAPTLWMLWTRTSSLCWYHHWGIKDEKEFLFVSWSPGSAKTNTTLSGSSKIELVTFLFIPVAWKINQRQPAEGTWYPWLTNTRVMDNFRDSSQGDIPPTHPPPFFNRKLYGTVSTFFNWILAHAWFPSSSPP